KILHNQEYDKLSLEDRALMDVKIAPMLEKFGSNYKPTDGQGFMLPERAEELEKGFGRAYQIGHVFKGAHYENTIKIVKDKEGNSIEVVIPVMIKYSSIILSDDLIFETKKVKKVEKDLITGEEKIVEKEIKVIKHPEL